MKVKSGSIQLRIMLSTFIALAAAAAADLIVSAVSLRTGFLLIRQPEGPMNQVLAQHDLFFRLFGARVTWQFIALMIVLAVCVFLIVFYLLSRRLTSHIRLIEKDVRQMAEGDFHIRLSTAFGGELKTIAGSINQLAENVLAMQQRAEEAEQTKNELITDVAHDLRTPLTSIIGYIDLVRNDSGALSESDKAKYLDIAFAKAEKLNYLIDDLFSLTKSSYGRMPMQLRDIDLVSLLSQAVDEFYPVFEEHSLICHMESDTEKCMIRADGEQLFRVFDNLLSNAVRYGRDGKMIRVKIKTSQDHATVHVVNYGNVIPEESLPHLFDKFYKVDPARNDDAGGTGLGLAIAKSIVENHHGRIGVSSSFEGTDFYVVLPFAQAKEGGGV